jgi:uncharacterized protein (DUF58 family)
VLEKAVASRKGPFDPYAVDWGSILPLRLRAATIAEGLYAGMHRSVLKGSGVEFAGQRPYVRGDDLRFVDKRALLRHDKLMLREFETETDRALWLVVDATLSMSFRGGGPASKYPFAALLAAVLCRVALQGGDPVGLLIVGGKTPSLLQASGAREMFHRVSDALSQLTPAGDWSERDGDFEHALAPLHEKARRGSTIVLLSDLVDLPEKGLQRVTELATRNRRVHVVRVLSPEEATLPFKEQARWTSLEGNFVVEANPIAARELYLKELAALETRWRDSLARTGGSITRALTSEEPAQVVVQLLHRIRGLSEAAGERTP